MKIAFARVVTRPSELLDAQLAFHLGAGADVAVLACSQSALGKVSERYGDRADVRAGGRPAIVQAVIEEHDADWVIDARDGEFWWPRGENLRDVLAPMPDRYGVVQGLIRPFVAVDDGGGCAIWEHATARRSLLVHPPNPGTLPSSQLRPLFRTHPNLDLDDPAGGRGARQPLRAWYPIEVLTLPVGAEAHDALAVERGLADHSLVVDERLRDALLAVAEGRALTLPVPGVVDDAAYAGECAAVGEVDLESLERQIRELERRVVGLEARFWPRVTRLGSRVLRRSR